MQFRKAFIVTPIAVCVFALLMFCMPQPSEEQPFQPKKLSLADLRSQIQSMQQKEGLQHALLGAYVVDMDSAGKVLLDYNGQWALSTGSTMKVITTTTALATLGTDFTFQTDLSYSGSIDAKGILTGNIYIKGGGDPTLGIENLNGLMSQWVNAIQKAGIKGIKGDIVGDASFFEPYLLPRTWIWEDIGNYYGAGACGLNIHENYYTLYCKTAQPNTEASILETQPSIPSLTFTNKFIAGPAGSGDNGYIFGAPFTYQRVLRGTIPPNQNRFAIKGALPDPALQCAQWLQEALQKNGVNTAEAKVVGLYEPNKEVTENQLLISIKSPKLSEIVAKTNTKSINTYAEALLKMVGYQQNKEGSTLAGTEAVAEFWKQQGLDMEGFIMEDGSGLSRFNAITAKQMGQIMRKSASMSWFGSFYASLAISGQTGTLRNICKGQAAQGRIFAKSGSINRVRCYTGYANTYQGKQVAFAIFINSYTGKYGALTPDFEAFFNTLAQLDW